METDSVNDSVAIKPQRNDELIIMVLRMFARQVAARKSTNQPKPLKKQKV